MARGKEIYKVGKKFCFPDVPSNWISATTKSVAQRQNYLPKNLILYPLTSVLPRSFEKVKFEELNIEYVRPIAPIEHYEEDEKYWFYHHRCIKYKSYNNISDGFALCQSKKHQLMKTFNPDYGNDDVDSSIGLYSCKSLDVISLLSRDGSNSNTNTNANCYDYLIRKDGEVVKIDSLRGKNVLVCCFYVPVLWLNHAVGNNIRGIITHYATSGGDYEMVMVAKMRDNWADDKLVFDHFFSAFPSSCLAIPFQDTLRRNYVCDTLGLTLDEEGVGIRVESDLKFVGYDALSCFNLNGFDFHPFITARSFDLRPWEPTLQLESLLGCDFLYEINDNYYDLARLGVCADKVPISEFKDKLVGLYLCYSGSFIRTLDLISRECKARNQEFLVVLVYIPYKESVNPRFFMEAINHVLRNLNISNWCVSPFNDLFSRRIWEFYNWNFFDREYCSDLYYDDRLLILDPHVNYIDPYGKYVFDKYGIDAYPFTREFIVNKELEEIRAATLESWLVYGSRNHVLRMNINNDIVNVDKVSIEELRGKIIFLYVVSDHSKPCEKYYTFIDWVYKNKKARHSDFEAVLVQTSENHQSLMWTPCLVCPYDPQYAKFVRQKILKRRYDMIIAFGKDGHIITLDALHLLDSNVQKSITSLECYNGLRNELIEHIGVCCDIYMTDL